MKNLNASNPRYVKCIKPNENKKPGLFDHNSVCDQLNSAGVLEAVKIRKAGYSIRRTKEEFVKRYHPLTASLMLMVNKKNNNDINYHSICEKVIKIFLKNFL